MKNILLVVLYKIKIGESPTIQSIVNYVKSIDPENLKSYQLFIWDNSPDICHDIEAFKQEYSFLDIEYVHTPQNMTLSKIYNQIGQISIQMNSYLTLFDQDTTIEFKYFEQLKNAQSIGYPLILPKIQCNEILVSPGKRFMSKGILLKNIESGTMNSKNLLAINSGMSISSAVFLLIQYDERLRFYGTDTYFMRQYEKYYNTVFILDSVLEHSLAEMEEHTIEWLTKHDQEKLEIFRIVFTETFFEKLFVSLYSLVIKYKIFLRNRRG